VPISIQRWPRLLPSRQGSLADRGIRSAILARSLISLDDLATQHVVSDGVVHLWGLLDRPKNIRLLAVAEASLACADLDE